MNRYQQLFTRLKTINEIAFVPFVTLGDPNVSTSLNIINLLVDNGADALELGIPFSDPIADGTIIQKANLRALNSKVTLQNCFEMLLSIRDKYPTIPIGILMYANLLFSSNINDFYHKLSNIGIDSVLIVDIPLEESNKIRKIANNHNISQIFICPPNANDKLLQDIALYSKGYVYLTSRSGVTGIDNKYDKSLKILIKTLNKYNSSPILQGFGISTPFQIKKLINYNIDGIISGSAIIKIIETNIYNNITMFKKISSFIKEMKQATKIINIKN